MKPTTMAFHIIIGWTLIVFAQNFPREEKKTAPVRRDTPVNQAKDQVTQLEMTVTPQWKRH